MTTDKKLLSGFATAFYRHIPVDDIAGWKAEDLSAVAGAMCQWAESRKAGVQKVRVFTPEQKRDGWQAPHTIIQIVNDDMPFIIDSVTAELAARNLTVDVLFHPIMTAQRGKNGALEEVGRGKGDLVESYVHIQLEQMLSAEAAEDLSARLHAILDDVRDATHDWKALMSRMEDVIRDMTTISGPTRPEELREAEDFLKYLQMNNFTFLGYREFSFSGAGGKAASASVKNSGLGVLRRNGTQCFGQGAASPEIQALEKSSSPVLISKLIEEYSAVHRRVPMDAVGVRIYDAKGRLAGMHLFVGLFTSSTYSCRTGEVPIVRQKVREIIRRSGFASGTHDRKALEHILEKMPRDELFQVTEDELYATALGILRLQAKHRIALFTHTDPMQQYMSCLVYVPRDRYNTKFRELAEKILERALGGKSTNYFTNLDDSPLARVLFTIRLRAGAPKSFDAPAVERELIELGREWDERLKQFLVVTHGKKQGTELAYIYGKAFNSAYQEDVAIKNVAHDIRRIEDLLKGEERICVEFYQLHDAPLTSARLKVYHKDTPVPLSDILPVLENMGLKSLSESPYEVKPKGATPRTVWIHDFALQGLEAISLEKVKKNFEEAFLRIWSGHAENDGLNQLVLRANLSWREVLVLRTYNRFMRQEKFPFSSAYIEQVLGMYPQIARALVDLFVERHDPRLKTAPEKRGEKLDAQIGEMLQAVSKLDHDRILRGMKTLIDKTLRTSYFQTDANGQPKFALAIKLDSKNIPDLPLPRPHVEIFVYSTRVEAVHLRGGEIARGGIRWSDRHDDFRTEILGLIKAQMVKNAVIVPVGAKGGFIVKQPPKAPPGEAGKNFNAREAYQAEGIACYKIFIQALLDITDNNVKGKIVRPKDVVFHDGVDPYLVVAADKGTATFSNIANEISVKNNFWLQDAFASGGSTGYDHKAIGITARGGWESVKRHFREIGKDIQTQVFTATGVGDMAGDVFGNGVLLSEKMKLIGAFNHVHIFCDPDPDPVKSFAERDRMFKARLGWDGYDKAKLSAGGMIYERSAKTLKLTPQIKKSFGISQDSVTPDELIRAILKAETELLWFGGIGTFIKSSKQSHADADDKSNDNLRVDATEIRAKVVGEGANLGVTQLARVEYAQNGGRINTDFIDNSGGVDCSDHEVNIKILLADVVEKGKLTLAQRNKLMEQMTEEVSALVLRDNYQQTQSLSVLLHRAREHLGLHADFMRSLEKAGLLNRKIEGLPDDEAIARLARDGRGLTRPELAVLLAYAKMTLFNQLMASDIPDDKAMEGLLFDYFPKVLHKYDTEIRNHKLKRGLIATQIVNILVNRMGPIFVQSRITKTGASAEEVIRAFMIVSDAFGVPDILKSVEALDNKVPCAVQMAAIYDVYLVVKRAVTWFLRFGGGHLQVDEGIAAFKPGVEELKKSISTLIPEGMRGQLGAETSKFSSRSMPAKIAEEIAVMGLLSSANDIITIAQKSKADIRAIAASYFLTGERLGLDWLRRKASELVPQNDWQSRVISGLTDDFFSQQAALTAEILRASRKNSAKDQKKVIDDWFDTHQDIVGQVVDMVADLRRAADVTIEMLTLVSQRLGQLVHQVKA